MEKRWVGCDPQNFRVGRPVGLRPDMIVLHSARGTVADATRTFFTSGSARSAHYLVATNGSITQHVQETDTAFHAGLKVNPSSSLVKSRPAINPNFYSIGIEHEGLPTNPEWSNGQVKASAALIGEIAIRWRIPLDSLHVVMHDAIRASANCPGPACDIDLLLRLASAEPGETTFEAAQSLTITARANIRRAPDVGAEVMAIAPPGSPFNATSVTRGSPVSGNDWWYVDASGRYIWAGATNQPIPEQVEEDVSTDEMEHARPAVAAAPSVAPPAPTAAALTFNRSLVLEPEDYVATATAKNLIVLHFTAGQSARSAWDTWRNDPRRIATAYIVDRDGTIYETFDPRYWASHLGIKGGPMHDKRSIGIEIANVGPLTPTADQKALNWWVGQTFCSIDEHDKYHQKTYRGFEYYAAFPAAQVASVGALVRHLMQRFSIPGNVAAQAKRAEFDDTFFGSFKGIATHANFRKDKFDIGPAFEWDQLL